MTKDEWLQVKQQLSQPYGSVKLTVDGYTLALQVQLIKPLKYGICVFVNGVCKGVWHKGEADEAKRFFRPVVMAAYSPAKKKAALKGFRSKADIKSMTDLLRLDRAWTFWNSYWLTFAPLQRHLMANNKSIELAKEEVLPS